MLDTSKANKHDAFRLRVAFLAITAQQVRAQRTSIARAQRCSRVGRLRAGMSAETVHLGRFNVVLGTSSKWRQSLFRERFPDIEFSAKSADIDEKAINGGYAERDVADPSELTLAIAHAKASAIVPSLGAHTLLITFDQVLLHGGRIREKPRDESECREYLHSYEHEPVKTISAVVVVNSDSQQRFQGVDMATQRLRKLPEEVVDSVIKKGDVLFSAGGITVEDPLLEPYLAEREGTLDSIMGMPVALVKSLLTQAARSSFAQ